MGDKNFLLFMVVAFLLVVLLSPLFLKNQQQPPQPQPTPPIGQNQPQPQTATSPAPATAEKNPQAAVHTRQK
jgi:hypothetical protein